MLEPDIVNNHHRRVSLNPNFLWQPLSLISNKLVGRPQLLKAGSGESVNQTLFGYEEGIT